MPHPRYTTGAAIARSDPLEEGPVREHGPASRRRPATARGHLHHPGGVDCSVVTSLVLSLHGLTCISGSVTRNVQALPPLEDAKKKKKKGGGKKGKKK